VPYVTAVAALILLTESAAFPTAAFPEIPKRSGGVQENLFWNNRIILIPKRVQMHAFLLRASESTKNVKSAKRINFPYYSCPLQDAIFGKM
jgi:hypothetical protein